MPKIVSFLSDLVGGSKLQGEFVKDPHATMKKWGLKPAQRKFVLSLKGKGATKRHAKRLGEAVAAELNGLGDGKHTPHW
jgi:hypothetical protein